MQRTGGGQLDAAGREDGTKGGMSRGTDALARRASPARYRDEFHSPDRFQRRGRDAEGRFRDRESAASQIREGTIGETRNPWIRRGIQGVESCRR